MRFWLKFESDFVLTFLIDAEVPEKINAYSFSQLHHKDRTSAKTSRGVKTHSMNQGRSQSGSSEHAKTVVHDVIKYPSIVRTVDVSWVKLDPKNFLQRRQNVQAALSLQKSSSPDLKITKWCFYFSKESISSWWSYVSEDAGHRFGIFQWYSLNLC